jgi:hypothetical protein
MTITHVVIFSFKPDISDAEREEVRNSLICPERVPNVTFVYQALNALREIKDKALHPTTGKPLVKGLTGGKNNSPKNFNVGNSIS